MENNRHSDPNNVNRSICALRAVKAKACKNDERQKMIDHHLRAMALGLLALGAGLGTSTAFAQVGYDDPSSADAGYAQPYDDGGQQAVPTNRMGHFSCGYNEVHTRLERKNCGGTHYRN